MTAGGPERLFYDGTCALCHGAVRFVLARDPEGRAFRFAPIGGPAFRGVDTGGNLPDSLVVETAEGAVLTRSTAVLHILERLGGGWGTLGRLGRFVPRPLRDGAYDLVARTRYRIFGRKEEACPRLPEHLRSRFDL